MLVVTKYGQSKDKFVVGTKVGTKFVPTRGSINKIKKAFPVEKRIVKMTN